MPDKRRVHSAIAIELFFKGKNDQRLVDILAQKFDPSLPPRPELRADVINDWNPAPAHLPRHAPVKGWSVDNDSERRALLIGRANQLLIESKNLRQVADDFGDADNGQVFCVDDDLAACRAHPLSARPEETDLPSLRRGRRPRLPGGAKLRPPPQRVDQLRAIHVSRSLTGGD